jgi:hypothetical protein
MTKEADGFKKHSSDSGPGLRKRSLQSGAATKGEDRRSRGVGSDRYSLELTIEIEHLVEGHVQVLSGGEFVRKGTLKIESGNI